MKRTARGTQTAVSNRGVWFRVQNRRSYGNKRSAVNMYPKAHQRWAGRGRGGPELQYRSRGGTQRGCSGTGSGRRSGTLRTSEQWEDSS
ncbi:hypothetical protein SKAU_G00287240 [Synaphobranchus kaupii]|uniref:Uncharacterized protein n=1 Tax=Synaphobranchus kaupii TaxID=118154 RepID=A0A9Q1EYG9_SYNKA|nr:hypothetical protein SKAU_G00287240 [Synaphobranchus kaupii]